MDDNGIEYQYIKGAKCEHCGAERIVNNCVLCGAPVCCISCCKNSFELDGKNMEIEKLKNELQCEKNRANVLELVASKPCKDCEYNGSPTYESMERRIKELEFQLELQTGAVSILRAENERINMETEKAFDTGFDAGLYRGFENASKENGKQIQKPKAMTFTEFESQIFGIV